jgi:hypothetical protein
MIMMDDRRKKSSRAAVPPCNVKLVPTITVFFLFFLTFLPLHWSGLHEGGVPEYLIGIAA